MSALRPDLAVIAADVPRGTRVLDVGCGAGTLMAALRDRRGCDVRGIELDPGLVSAAVGRGLAVVQGDAEVELAGYPADGFDIAVLSQTLQTARAPDRLVHALLRVAPTVFVSFPNFAHWRVRASLAWGGRMPVTRLLTESWYATPNIHHVTVYDFRAFSRKAGLRVEASWFLSGDRERSARAANLLADHAVFRLGRGR